MPETNQIKISTVKCAYCNKESISGIYKWSDTFLKAFVCYECNLKGDK